MDMKIKADLPITITFDGHDEEVIELVDEDNLTTIGYAVPRETYNITHRYNSHPRLIKAINNLSIALRTFSDNVPQKDQGWTCFDEESLNEAFAILEEEEHPGKYTDEWRNLYWYAVDGPCTVSCIECGVMIHGDSPDIGIECLDCFTKRRILEDANNLPEGYKDV